LLSLNLEFVHSGDFFRLWLLANAHARVISIKHIYSDWYDRASNSHHERVNVGGD
jgi:hypothetical protein